MVSLPLHTVFCDSTAKPESTDSRTEQRPALKGSVAQVVCDCLQPAKRSRCVPTLLGRYTDYWPV